MKSRSYSSRSSFSVYKLIFILAVIILVKVVFFNTYSGPDSIAEPIQDKFLDETIVHRDLNGKEVEITLIDSYEGNFAVKGVKKYETDGAASVSPRDFLLVWGDLMQDDIEKEIKYSQSFRWYHYQYSAASPVSGEYISQHSANTHIIPANISVLKEVKKVSKNDYIYLKGYLANVHFDTGDWSSSLTREDTGDGACEIFYVTEIQRNN